MSNADERLALIRAKVERAEQHIHDLDVALRAFLDSHPYLTARQTHPEGPEFMIYWLSGARPIPPLISLIAGDALTNLRAALDHLAYQLAVVNGTSDERVLRTTYFPISDDATKYEAEAPGKVKGMSQAAKEAIKACRPYHGGNDALWQLHRLNNRDKHRLLITVCTVQDENLEFAFQVAFNELEIAECEPVLETLQQMAHLVSHIINGFKPLLV